MALQSTSNFATIRAAQMATARDVESAAMAVNHDLGTLNDRGGKIHSPRKEELGRRFSLLVAQYLYANQTAAHNSSALGAHCITHGPVLASAKFQPSLPSTLSARSGGLEVVGTIELLFAPSAAQETQVYLHGTAGCIGGNSTPPCCPQGKGRPCCKPGPTGCSWSRTKRRVADFCLGWLQGSFGL